MNWRNAWQYLTSTDAQRQQNADEDRARLRKVGMAQVRYAVVYALDMGAGPLDVVDVTEKVIQQWLAVHSGE
jgi:hypothetical protein